MVDKHPMAGGEYVRDRHGVIWRVVRDGGMVTTADDTGITTAGIHWAEAAYGPLTPVLDAAEVEKQVAAEAARFFYADPPSPSLLGVVRKWRRRWGRP